LFYGRKGKDTISPQQLVERLEKAARVAGWNALANPGQPKTDEFFLSLRDNALSWYNTLDNIIGFNKEDWDKLKKKFLEAYAPKYSAKALCICFQDLRQKSDESVQDFYNKVSDTFHNAYQTKPDHKVTFVGTLPGTATQAECDVVLKQGVKHMQLLMLNTVFLGGLREEIRNQVLEDGPTNPDESVKAAREIESIINDRRKEKGFHVTNIEGPPEDEEAEDVGEVDEQEAAKLREVNTILRKKGRPQYRFRVRPQRGQQRGSYRTGANGSFNGTGAIVCFFCNKPGHRIAQCLDNPATKRGRRRGLRRVAAIEEVAYGQDSNNSLNY
jgi:Retrotransposon gag protein